MDNPGEILLLCRLCLVKDQVNIPIFEEQGDIRQIFLKISSCLPIKVSRDDQLPKKICDGCSNKLDLLYEFWNTSANAEKTLLSWLGQAGVKDADETINAVAQQIAKPAETQVKEETETLEDGHVNSQNQDNFEPQSFDEGTKDEDEAPPPKRARRSAAVKAQINITPESDDDDDLDSAEPMTKMEGESDESDGEEKDPSYAEVPGTSADDQAGPSGVGKDGAEAPLSPSIKIESQELVRTIKSDQLTLNRKSPSAKSDGLKLKKCTIKCPNCPKTFDQKFKLKAHIIVHNSEKPFSCSSCETGFKTNSALRRHIRDIHEQTRKFSCAECGKEFNSKTNYVIHTKRHMLEFVVHCEHCNEGFVTKAEYRRHLDAKHNRKECVCDTCGKTISSERHLKEHRRLHEKDYEDRYFQECTICHRKFRHLKKHIRETHEGGGNNYICHTCGKSFRGENSFKVHLMIHKGVRPYQCELCHKQFYSKQYLTVHWRVHTGEKPYECEVCGKGFAQKPPLKIHMRLHSGERPYECDVCKEKFVSKQKLTFHKKSAHQIVNFRNIKSSD